MPLMMRPTAVIETTEILSGGEPLLARVRAEATARPLARIRLALGYLFVPGLAPVWDALEAGTPGEIQLLIGNTAQTLTDEQQVALTDEVADAGRPDDSRSAAQDVAGVARAARARIVAETARALRENLARIAPEDAAVIHVLLGLARAASAGQLRVRIYPDGRLHAKAYLFEGGEGEGAVGLVGSTNLSLPSHGNSTELNVVVRDRAAAQVGDWFDALWTVGQDFTRDLLTEILSAPCLQTI